MCSAPFPFVKSNVWFASWFQFANGEDFCGLAKHLTRLWKNGKGEGENASICVDSG